MEIRIEPFRRTQRDAAPCLEEESKGRAEMISLTWVQSSPPSSGEDVDPDGPWMHPGSSFPSGSDVFSSSSENLQNVEEAAPLETVPS